MADIAKITLTTTMLHELPRGRQKDDDSDILYSSAPTPLDPATDRFIREEMLDPFLPGAREVVDAELGVSPVPRLARDTLEHPANLAANSKVIADWMHKKQRGGSSAGVFAASLAKSDGLDRFVILKAEHQEGVRLNHSGSGANVVFKAEHLTELIMGQNSQVYKIGVLWLHRESGKLVGLMVDKQNGAGFADFFLVDFLGCDLTHRAEVLTQEFVKRISTFINSNLLTEDKKLRYAGAAVAVLESPNAKLKPSRFLTEFIDADDRDMAADILGVQVLATEFRKDTTLVRSQIGGLQLRTNTKVTISASSEAMSDGTVTLDSDNADGPRIIVKGRPDDYKLAKKPK